MAASSAELASWAYAVPTFKQSAAALMEGPVQS